MKPNLSRRLTLAASLLAAGVLGAAQKAFADAPVFSSYTVMGISSITVTWTGGGGGITDTYQAILSTNPSPSTNGNSGNQIVTGLTGFAAPSFISATFTSLATNTTYYVDAIDQATDVSTTSFPATSTFADAPSPNGPMTAGSNTLTPIWNPYDNVSGSCVATPPSPTYPGCANPAWTVYEIQISTDPGFSVLLTTSEFVTTAQNPTFGGLSTNTLYYTRIQALDNGGNASVGGFIALPNTYTTPASLGQGFISVGTTFATVIWGNGGNSAGTTYQPVVSTSPTPIDWNAEAIGSLRTTNLYQNFSGLIPNTFYNSAVAALPNGGGSPVYAELGSTWTLANTPLSPVGSPSSGLAGPRIAYSWNPNGNPTVTPLTLYEVQYSTRPDFIPLWTTGGGGDDIVSSPADSVGNLHNDLVVLTTYYLRVRAQNNASTPNLTAFSSPVSVETLSNQPGTPSLSVTTMTATANWVRNGNIAPANFTAILSTGPSPSTNGGSLNQNFTTAANSYQFSGLTPNTVYFVDVSTGPLGTGALFSSSPGGTPTLAVAPSTGAITSISSFSIAANWTAPLDPSGTQFRLQVSSNAAFNPSLAPVLSSTTLMTAATVSGLAALTTYYLEVEAINSNGVETGYIPYNGVAITWPSGPPSTPVLSSTTLGTSSVTWSWSAAPLSTAYRIVDTSSGNVSGNLPPSTLSWTETGLSTNTAYTRALVAVNQVGVSTSSWLTAATFAAAPATGTITAISPTSIAANWAGLSNPAGTLYEFEASTSSAFELTFPRVVIYSSKTALTAATISGLAALTTYYLQVAAINVYGTTTTFVQYDGFTVTWPSLAPAVPALSSTTLGTSSVTWSWSGVPLVTGYRVLNSTFGNISGDLPISSFSWTETGLSTNTSYTRYLAAFNGIGASTSAALAASTFADPPTAGSITAVSSNSVTANWGSSDDPPGTLYQLEASSSPVFAPPVSRSAITTSTTATVPGLAALTTYYLQVQAISFGFDATAFVPIAGSSPTWPAATPAIPVLSSAAYTTTSVTWTWSPIPLVTGYRILNSTFGSISGELPISSVSWTDTGLSTNTSYTRYLAADNQIGASTSAAAVAATLAAAPSAPSFFVVGFSSVTFSWLTNTNPSPSTRYTAEIWNSTSSLLPTVSTTTAVSTAASVTFTGLSLNATYFMDVYAQNLSGLATAHSASTSTFLPYIVYDSTTIYPNAGGTLFLHTNDGPVTVSFPPGAFPVAVTATLQAPSADTVNNPYINEPGALPSALSHAAEMSPTFVGTELTVVSLAQPSVHLQPLQPVSITLGYPAAKVPANVKADQLTMAYYDPLENLFVPIPSTSDAPDKLVTGQSPHLSFFEIMAVIPAANLSSPKVFPNPFRPALGHTSITFSQMPANTRVRIYTILGELVRDLSTDDTGIARWDGANREGRAAASGGYFALAQANGAKIVLKVLIQR